MDPNKPLPDSFYGRNDIENLIFWIAKNMPSSGGGTEGGATEETLANLRDNNHIDLSNVKTILEYLLIELDKKADYNETQPVSAESLPLPEGASTESTLIALYNVMKRVIASSGAVVTKNIAIPTPGTLYIGTGGNLLCTLEGMNDGDFLEFRSVPDGYNFPHIVKFVHGDSTCDNIIVNIP